MKSLLVGLVALLPTVADAASLPVQGRYCFEAMDLSADGYGFEDSFCAVIDAKNAPSYRFHCVGSEPEWGIDEEVVATVIENRSAQTVTFTDGGGTTILRRCD